MVVTFPHLGNTYIACKIMFDSLGIDYVIPPLSNKEALRIGAFHSPDEICLPFKIMIGNYIQSIEKGADTVIIVGSCGPCRLGEYCELQMSVLKNLGYQVKFIVVDYPGEIGIKELASRIGYISNQSHKKKIEKLRALYRAVKAIRLMDYIEQSARMIAGYEINRGECKRLLLQCRDRVFNESDPSKALKILKSYKAKLSKIPIDKKRKPLKIAIVGEIYTNIESFANHFIEDTLMDYGIATYKSLSPSWWLKYTGLKVLKLHAVRARLAAKQYLKYEVGAYAKETVGEAVLAYERGYDGIIHLLPVGCMPEIVSKSILTSIAKEKDIPIMTLLFDEMTGEAGYLTRIEAFIDLLERRRRDHVLSWR